ncbi:F-box domain, cyclin-like protein [Nannochloropsis gaditana]|uniref:F-box domain, cyclin-like protein n=1 Tax=Nannochloropsis gaditana TaxID=72520 RepID=W7T3I7_9STRA|nr:F-box domain, cyclin-like protein [Nannochloropsis gaditana]
MPPHRRGSPSSSHSFTRPSLCQPVVLPPSNFSFSLPEDVVCRVLDYLPRSIRSFAPICRINRMWRRLGTRDDIWEPLINQEYGQSMLKRLDITKNVHRFYVGQQRARICCQPLLRSAGGEDETVCCTLPPESFFQPFTWIVEVREVQHQSLVYSTALSLADGEERGRLFTSAGLFVIGKGLQLGIDVKSRLQPAQASLGGNAKALPRDRRREGHPGVGGGPDGGRACGVVRVRGRGGGAHAHRCRRVKMGRRSGAWRCEEERETGGGEEMASEEVARSGWGRAMGAGGDRHDGQRGGGRGGGRRGGGGARRKAGLALHPRDLRPGARTFRVPGQESTGGASPPSMGREVLGRGF